MRFKHLFGMVCCFLASFCGAIGRGKIGALASEWKYKCAEVCDGEVVEMEPLSFTYYIYPDRNFDDLANKKRRTVGDIEKLIDHVLSLHPDSAFKGEAQSFIKASNETGLDPIFLFALAGIESGWGTNNTHLLLCNPYSIHMFGDGVHHGYELGSTFGEGIVAGAVFIYEEYYCTGQTTLYLMNHDKSGNRHNYCNGDPDWEFQIASEMSFLEGLLK